jgi:hypothetical protein
MAERKEPAWVGAYLAALERSGNARLAAVEAGIDHTTAYQRRLKRPEFGAAWAAALERWRADGAVDGARSPPAPRASTSGEELVERVTARHGRQLVRAGVGRWSKKAEEAFLSELAACANVRRSAAAAGFSTNTMLKRKRRDPRFAAAWDEAIAIAGTRVDAYLVETADRTFDPANAADIGDAPKMTVAEAIKFSQLTQARSAKAAAGKAQTSGRGWIVGEDWGTPEEEEQRTEEIRARILDRLDRIRELDEEKKLEEGWTRVEVPGADERTPDAQRWTWVPPGFEQVVDVKALPGLDESYAEVPEEAEKTGPRVRGL